MKKYLSFLFFIGLGGYLFLSMDGSPDQEVEGKSTVEHEEVKLEVKSRKKLNELTILEKRKAFDQLNDLRKSPKFVQRKKEGFRTEKENFTPKFSRSPSSNLIHKEDYQPPFEISEFDLENLQEIESNRETRKVLKDIVAIPNSEIKNFSPDQIIFKRGAVSYVRKEEVKDKSKIKIATFNPRTKTLGYLSGKIKVKFKSISNLNALKKEFPSLVVESTFKPLNIVFFTSKDGNVERIFSDLQGNDLIKSSEIDVIEHVIKPH